MSDDYEKITKKRKITKTTSEFKITVVHHGKFKDLSEVLRIRGRSGTDEYNWELIETDTETKTETYETSRSVKHKKADNRALKEIIRRAAVTAGYIHFKCNQMIQTSNRNWGFHIEGSYAYGDPDWTLRTRRGDGRSGYYISITYKDQKLVSQRRIPFESNGYWQDEECLRLEISIADPELESKLVKYLQGYMYIANLEADGKQTNRGYWGQKSIKKTKEDLKLEAEMKSRFCTGDGTVSIGKRKNDI